MTDLTDDVIYVARATGIAAKDLHAITAKFRRDISECGTANSIAMASAFLRWLAETSVSLWEKMIPVGVTPEGISAHYELGYALAKMFDALGERGYGDELRARWDNVLVNLQEIRDEYGTDMAEVKDEA